MRAMLLIHVMRRYRHAMVVFICDVLARRDCVALCFMCRKAPSLPWAPHRRCPPWTCSRGYRCPWGRGPSLVPNRAMSRTRSQIHLLCIHAWFEGMAPDGWNLFVSAASLTYLVALTGSQLSHVLHRSPSLATRCYPAMSRGKLWAELLCWLLCRRPVYGSSCSR